MSQFPTPPPVMKSDHDLLAELDAHFAEQQKELCSSVEHLIVVPLFFVGVGAVAYTTMLDLPYSVKVALTGVGLLALAFVGTPILLGAWTEKLGQWMYNKMFAQKHKQRAQKCAEKIRANDWSHPCLKKIWPNAERFTVLTAKEIDDLGKEMQQAPLHTQQLWLDMLKKNKPFRRQEQYILKMWLVAEQQKIAEEQRAFENSSQHVLAQQEQLQKWLPKEEDSVVGTASLSDVECPEADPPHQSVLARLRRHTHLS